MKRMNKTMRFAVKLAVLGLTTTALAYEVTTHKVLTRLAVQNSKLVRYSLLSELGLTSADVVEAIATGAEMEDNDYGWRAFNHFFDPQYNGNRGRGLSVLVVNGNPSPSWILEDLDHQSDYYDGSKDCPYKGTLTPCPQQYSFRLGQQQLFKALTAATAAERDAATALVLKDVGHVVHHIQDMAQPQHTRNDQHTHPLPMTHFNPQWAFYEVYTEENNDRIPGIVADNPYVWYVKFPTARKFWYTVGVAGQYAGMADFTANNFTSYGTQYVAQSGNPSYIGAAPGFPLPNGKNPDGSSRSIKSITETVVGTDGRTRTGSADYIVGTVYDGYINRSSIEIPLAATSLISDLAAEAPNFTPIYIENSLVYEGRYKVLLPRAVAFSTGLIDHFFRGRLDITQGGTAGTWDITNSGSQDMDGIVNVMAEDASGNRTLLNDSQDARKLAAGASINLSLNVPKDTKKLVAVFHGKIGEEGETSGTDWYAVAGKVIDYVPPAIPCGTPVSRSGGSGPTTFIQDLGGTPGTVTINFEAYSVPDAFKITPDNNTTVTLKSSNGQVANAHTYTFEHQPDVRKSTKVSVTVDGNDNPTVWNFAMSCPGAKPPAAQTVKVIFGLTNPASFDNCSLRYDLVVDGRVVGFPGYANMVPGEAHTYRLTISGPACNGTKLPYYKDNTGSYMMDSTAQQTFRVQ